MPCSERILKMVGGEEKDCEKGGGGGAGEEPQHTDNSFELDFSASTFL